MTIIDNNSTDVSDENIRLYLEDLSLRSWYNRKPVIVYLSMLVIVGLIGNTWCFLVYFFCFSINSTCTLVLAMSICDLVTNAIGLPLQIYTIRHAYDSYDVPLCRTMFVFATLPTQLSGFLILLVAFDRYRHICKPFAKKITARKAAKLVACAVILTLVLFLPFTWLYGYHTVNSPRPGVKAVMCWVHDDYLGGFYGRAYLIVVSTCFFGGLFILGILYSLIGETIFRHRFSISVRVRAVTVIYPHPHKGQNLMSYLGKSPSADCRSKAEGKAEEQGDSVEGQDNKTKYEHDSNTCIVTSLTGEDTPKPDFLSSPESNINKETRAYDVEDSTDLCERERIVDKKVTLGAISVIRDNKRLPEFLNSSGSTSEPSEEEIVTVEPGGNQVGPSENVIGKKYTSPRIFRILTLTGEDTPKPDFLSSPACNTNKETREYNVEDSTDLYERKKIHRKFTVGPISVKRDSNKLSELMESYERTLEPSEEEIVTAEPGENQVGPSENVIEMKCTTPRIFRISKVHHSRAIQIQTTVMMATLTAFYVVNWLPHLIARVVTDLPVNMCDNFTDCGSNFYALSLRSYYLLSASNAFIYSFCNSKFRKESRNLFSMILNFCKR